MKNLDKPIVFTMGDPSGVGPEIIVKTICREILDFNFIVIGDNLIMKDIIKKLNYDIKINKIVDPRDAVYKKNIINLLQVGEFKKIPEKGKIVKNNGNTSYKYILKAIELINHKKISAIVTAPINKHSLYLDGINYSGHTEIFSEHSISKNVSMMIMNEKIKTVLVTTHLSLRNAIEKLSIEGELNAMQQAFEWMNRIGIEDPKIGVSALNPHAGEYGQFGDEESKIIIPAINIAKSQGINALGPIPADTIFMKAREGVYDIVVAQYHDQGLIPIKYLGLDNGVNVTIGLDFIRTSPDHGTAYDIAGNGIANHKSFHRAASYALDLIKLWDKYHK